MSDSAQVTKVAAEQDPAERAAGPPDAERSNAERRPSTLGALASDVFVGLLLAALVVVTMLFASGISRFVYIDF